ncbi:DUF3320 domain-containing protein [Acidiphilium sp.]|uniref:DUF3320 domain-containing protein n=1 Tax=Acidiphilium sp. TaxID=527 RepID=UPI003D047B5D
MIEIRAIVATKIGFASHQNAVPLLRELSIINHGSVSHQNLKLMLTADPPAFAPRMWALAHLAPGDTRQVMDRDVALNAAFLGDLDEAIAGTITLRLTEDETELAAMVYPIDLLARTEWGGMSSMAELLPAFVMPNDPAIDRILKTASDVLRRAGKPDAIDGYESKSRQRVWQLVGALWAAVCELRLSYALPPASFEQQGQKIRSPGSILQGRVATCLDLTVLFAAALEQARLNPIIVLARGHAFAGVWLQPGVMPSLITDEAAALRRRLDLDELLVFETTLAANAHPPSFSATIAQGRRQLAEDADAPFEMAIDVARARMQRIRPLAAMADPAQLAEPNAPAVFEALEAPPNLSDFEAESAEPDVALSPIDRIAMWQRKLLNLTTANRLLNVPASAKFIRLICPDAALLEDQLADGKKIRIVAMPDLQPGGRDEKLYATQNNENLRTELATEAMARHEILAEGEEGKLDNTLIELFRQAKTDFAEGGANTLFLALGFLKWRKSPAEQRFYQAPLLLVPVRLERKSAVSKIIMTRHEDEARFNLTLLELLRQDFGLTIPALAGPLPEDRSGIDVAAIWTTVRTAIRDMTGFEVVPNVVLGTFSFAKYLMWKDLVDRAAMLKESPVVRHLLERGQAAFPARGEFPRPEHLDQRIDPADLFIPLPADSSQIAAIVASGEGHDFVLDGPPGTGKSQTIANIIAHNLARGRRVLFVAEKMAALEVVQRRLATVGLGSFCLELHSAKATKTEVLRQLDDAWTTRDQMAAAMWASEAAEVKRLRDELNRIVALLHRPHANGLTLHGAIGRVVRDWTEMTPRLVFPLGCQHSAVELAATRETMRRLCLARSEVFDVPTGLGNLATQEWSNAWQDTLVEAARGFISAESDLCQACQSFASVTGLDPITETSTQLGHWLRLAMLLPKAHGYDLSFAFAPQVPEWIAKLREAITCLQRYREIEAMLSTSYATEAVRRLDLAALNTEWIAANKKFFLFKGGACKKVIQTLANVGGTAGPPDPAKDLPRLETMAQELARLDVLTPALAGVSNWAGVATDLDRLQISIDIVEALRSSTSVLAADLSALTQLRYTLTLLLSDGNDLLASDGPVSLAVKRLSDAAQVCEITTQSFISHGELRHSETFADLRDSAQAVISHARRLKPWTDWQRSRNDAIAMGLSPIIAAIESGQLSPDMAQSCFETAYAYWFASGEIDAEPDLRRFAATDHLDKVKAFRRLDHNLAALSVRYIKAKLCGLIPDKEAASQGGGYAVLRHQLQLKRAHKPIRQLASEMGEAFTRLAPCMLMSPLSVAQYLPPDQALFDLVIFDEASQIAPWDAIGAMARGRQVVIAGDPRQMPPTNFFARKSDEGDDEGGADMESILDECLAAGVTQHSLTWHYRSRHESLITFSNHRYYENRLVTFPAPQTRPSAVSWQMTAGAYARGAGRTNQIEARVLVDSAVARLTNPDFIARGWTLGIITLNVDQQRLVEDLLDKARRENAALERHFSEDLAEPVVVKNLETVQGDERDVIMLGIGFGPTEAGSSTMSMSFGPLNAAGGWRRLNVALTRSRQEMIIFTSFGPGMIDLTRTGARAIADLKHFLEFAERGPRALVTAVRGSVGDYESPFEIAVAIEMGKRGWVVVPQVGVSRFRIDLGIIHPDRHGDYLVGIECDGATYHSAATARDRDKIRAAILEDLGWKLLRIWSTDWWIDKQGAADRLHRAIEQCLADDRVTEATKCAIPEIESSESSTTTALENSISQMPNVPITKGQIVGTPPPRLENASERDIEFARAMSMPKSMFQQYHFADITLFNDRLKPEQFYDSNYDTTLSLLISHILGVEAPISESLLVQRIARAHGFQRAGRIIRERVMHLARSLHHVTNAADEGIFVWPDTASASGWKACRRPDSADDIRQIDDIAFAELAAAGEQLGDESDIVLAIARFFEVRRLSATARARIESALGRSP